MKEPRPFLIIANWKANAVEAKTWLQQFSIFNFQFLNKIDLVIAPPFTLISTLRDQLQISNFKFQICSQDVSAFPVGSYTGEIPAKLLADLGVKYCLVGHSERRKYLRETNVEIEGKINQAIQNDIVPILCAQSLEEIPENIRNFSGEKYLIMYEPFSAISTEGKYHPESVEKVMTTLSEWKRRLGLSCRFLYGGSINSDDASDYLKPETLPGRQAGWNLISGFVVGHASLEMESFTAIIKQCLQSLPSD